MRLTPGVTPRGLTRPDAWPVLLLSSLVSLSTGFQEDQVPREAAREGAVTWVFSQEGGRRHHKGALMHKLAPVWVWSVCPRCDVRCLTRGSAGERNPNL